MSIFGKSKKKDDVPAPPAPGGGFNDIKEEVSSNNNQGSNSNTPPAPPSFSSPSPQAGSSPSAPVAPPSAPSPSPQAGSSPSTPVAPPSAPSPSPQAGSNSNSISAPTNSQNQNSSMGQENQNPTQQNKNSVLDESLFNLEDFELPDLNDLDSINHQESNSNRQERGEVNSKNLSEHSSREEMDSSMHHHHSNSQFMRDSDFMPTKGLSHAKDDTYFLTTNEFKHLLELIDSVKDRIKTSGQRHMKITSIKAEEDIEYDNMKKDFQFIEDKLYEVDSTIFDR